MDLSKVCLTNDLFNIWTNSAAGIVVVLIVAIVIGLAIFQKACIKPLIPTRSCDGSDITVDSKMEMITLGSGICVPCTVEQTIAKQNKLQEVISSGQYGQV